MMRSLYNRYLKRDWYAVKHKLDKEYMYTKARNSKDAFYNLEEYFPFVVIDWMEIEKIGDEEALFLHKLSQ